MCVGELARLAELTGDAAVRARAIAAIGAASYFFYPSIDSDGSRCMRREEVISARNNNWPGRVDYGGSDFVAAALGDPVAARCGQLAAAQGRPRSAPAEGNAHFAAMLNDLVLGMESAEKAAALPQSAARLPMEDGQPDFAWADEQGQAVAVKDRDTRMYMSLNWRRGFADDRRDAAHARANNLARVHLTTAAVDRVATIAMESPYGFGRLYICRYGPYLVAMNASDTAAGALPPLPGVAGAAVDLVSKKRCDLKAGVKVPPATTVVLRLEDGK
jgi:hypothetical protein